jgi:hypothetical protein
LTKPIIGILGAGKLGTTLGKLLVEAGYPVLVSGSQSADKIQLTIDILVPGAESLTTEEVSKRADIVVLALPLSKYHHVDPHPLENKVIIDAMNYWWEVDGLEEVYSDGEQSSSERVQAYFEKSTVIKAFNHMGYHNLGDDARPNAHEDRKVVLMAGDQMDAVSKVETIIDHVGFTPLHIGELRDGVILESGSPLFGASLGLEEVQEKVRICLKEISNE